MSPLDLIVLSLATWRLSYMLARERGPYQLLTRLRARFDFQGDETGLLNCIYCTSVWAGAALYGLLLTPAYWLVYILAAAGGAMLMHRYTGGDHV